MINTRPVMADQGYKSSPFNRDFQSRLEMAMMDDDIAQKLETEAKAKAGKEDYYHGLNERDTSLVQRVTAQTFSDTNSSEYRTQERINTALREQAQRLEEDLAQQKKYLKDIQETLENNY